MHSSAIRGGAALLRDFLVLADVLHFRRAAETLAMSQSGLSQRIVRLEEMLGGRLFLRSTRRVRLTDRGEQLRRRAVSESHDALWGELIGQVRPRSGGDGQVRIGLCPLSGVRMLRTIQRAIRQPIAVSVVAGEEALVAVDRGQLDLALVWRPKPLPESRSLLVRTEPVVALCDESDPLTARSVVAASDLRERRILVMRSALLAANVVDGGRIESCTTTDELFSRVVGRGDVALVPGSALDYRPRGIESRPVAGAARVPLGLFWRRGLPDVHRQALYEAF